MTGHMMVANQHELGLWEAEIFKKYYLPLLQFEIRSIYTEGKRKQNN